MMTGIAAEDVDEPLLTIGVPTFNRRSSAVRLAASLVPLVQSSIARVVVVDDGSSDRTAEALEGMDLPPGFRVRRNPTNQGYARTFLRLLDEVSTDYLIVTSDDDHVIASELPRLVTWLRATEPDFVSTQFLRGESIYRGRRHTAPIDPGRIMRCSAHAPGLVYRTASVRGEMADRLRRRLDDECEFSRVYPQVSLVSELMVFGGSCWWWDGPTVREGDEAPTGITSSAGLVYRHPTSRWLQQLAWWDHLGRLATEVGTSAQQDALRAMMDSTTRSAYRTVERFLVDRHDFLEERLDESARRHLEESGSIQPALSTRWRRVGRRAPTALRRLWRAARPR